MVTQKNYINKVEHIWYESSNLVYTACYDGDRQQKTLKAVFKGGRTYIYKDVDVADYMLFTRTASSNGEAFNRNIVKRYKGVRVSDTDLDKLEELRKEYADENKKVEEVQSQLDYTLEINNETGEFRLILNGKNIYEGVEGQVSIINLLASMHIPYMMKEFNGKLVTEEDFIENVDKLELGQNDVSETESSGEELFQQIIQDEIDEITKVPKNVDKN